MGIIALVASIAAALYFALATDKSLVAKGVVVALVLASVVLQFGPGVIPGVPVVHFLVPLLTQVVVTIGVALVRVAEDSGL